MANQIFHAIKESLIPVPSSSPIHLFSPIAPISIRVYREERCLYQGHHLCRLTFSIVEKEETRWNDVACTKKRKKEKKKILGSSGEARK